MDVTFDQVEEFFEMLKGGSLPNGIAMENQPELNHEQAFSVIWFLQEHFKVLPDHIEMCVLCKDLFDAHCGGNYIDSDSWDSDDFYEQFGVTKEQVLAAAGTHLCSMECEMDFWRAGGARELPGER